MAYPVVHSRRSQPILRVLLAIAVMGGCLPAPVLAYRGDDDPTNATRDMALRLKNQFDYALGKKLTVDVIPIADGKYVIVLSGSVKSQEVMDKLIDKATKEKDKVPSVAVLDTEGVSVADPDKPYLKTAAFVADYFSHRLNDSDLKVKASPLFNIDPVTGESNFAGQYAVSISGTQVDQSAIDKAIAGARVYRDDLKKTYNIDVPPTELDVDGIVYSDRIITDTWTMFSIAADAPVDGGDLKPIQALIDSLNAIYAPKDTKVVQRDGARLWISAKRRDFLEILGALPLIDSAAPQVQLDTWAIQVTGNRGETGRQVTAINRDLEMTGERVRRVSSFLVAIMAKHAKEFADDHVLKPILVAITGSKDPTADDLQRPLSLNECLILLGLHKERCKLIDELACMTKEDASEVVRKLQPSRREADKTFHDAGGWDERFVAGGGIQGVKRLIADVSRHRDTKVEDLFTHLRAALRPEFLHIHRNGVHSLLERVFQYNEYLWALGAFGPRIPGFRCGHDGALYYSPDETLDGLRDAPLNLARDAGMVDRMLQALVEAFTADIEQTYTQPLLSRIKDGEGYSPSGVGLSARTRIVVTSRLPAALKPQLSSTVNLTQPAPFTKEDIKSILDTALTSKESAAAGAAQAIAGLPNVPALIVAAGMVSNSAPVYAAVAPGIEVNVTPSVAPDSSSADLKLDVKFGVETTIDPGQLKDRTDVYAPAAPDAVKSHAITTRLTINGSELFGVSSFTVSTSHPQGPLSLPVLGRLPIIGPVFQLPRGNKEVSHESIICVKATIIPRSLSMVGFYGAQRGPSATVAEHLTRADEWMNAKDIKDFNLKEPVRKQRASLANPRRAHGSQTDRR